MNFSVVFSYLAFLSTMILGVGIILWWFKREKTRLIRFPILKIIKRKPRRLTAIIRQNPPLLSFILFVIASGLVAFMVFLPSEQLPSEKSQKQRAHVFIDLSPSMASFITEDALRLEVKNLSAKLAENYILSMSTSSEIKPSQARGDEAVDEVIPQIHFHRPGLRLVNAISEHLSFLDDLDHLFIVSDGDSYSWQGFNWAVLAERVKIHFVDVSVDREMGENFYLEDISRGLILGQTEEFMLRIARNISGPEISGFINATYNGEKIFESQFHFASEVKTINIEARLPFLDGLSDKRGSKPQSEIIWHIDVPSEHDKLILDNVFMTSARGLRERIVISGGLAGEQDLAEPSYFLRKTLELFNFNIALFENPISFSESAYKDRLSILLYEDVYNPSDVCNISPPSTESSIVTPALWLAPAHEYTEFAYLCNCALKIYRLQLPNASVKEELCQDIKTRVDFNTLFRSLGASPLGGKVTDTSQSLAWILPKSKITVFSLPLMPNVQIGMSHGVFPLLVRELLVTQKMLSPDQDRKISNTWPRIADITKTYHLTDEEKKMNDKQFFQEKSNIPREESQLKLANLSDLPPRLSLPQDQLFAQEIEDTNTEKSYLRIIKFLSILLMTILGMDAVVNFTRRKQLKISAEKLLIILSLLSWGEMRAYSQVTLNIVRDGGKGEDLNFSNLKREVEDRTSLIFSSKPMQSSHVSNSALEQPWLWLMHAQSISELKKEERINLLLWLRRGGFLIVENSDVNQVILTKFFKNTFDSISPHEWKIISPDHELMRSFYLLDALNSCDPGIWQGYHFDKRLAVLAIPGSFLRLLSDKEGQKASRCNTNVNEEKLTRTFINILMVALATDYKKDQIHLPEILKRLRR